MYYFSLWALSLTYFLPTTLYAQESQSPIYVQKKRKVHKDNLPKYYQTTVLNKDQLNNVVHFEELTQEVPSLTYAGATSRARYYQLRGIGERSAYEGMPNSSISVLVDSIDYTGIGGVLNSLAIGSIQVYAGPQLTRSGPSSLAGTIEAHTTHNKKKKNQINLRVGSFSQKDISVTKSLQYKDWSFTSAAELNLSNGYFKNSYLNHNDTNKQDEKSIKLKLSNSNIEFNFHFFDFDNGYDVFNLENDKTTRSNAPGSDNQQTTGFSIIKETPINRFELQTTLSAHITKTLYSYDEDWGNDPFWLDYPNWNSRYDYRIEFEKDIKNLNFENKLMWDTSWAEHTSGIFYKHTQTDQKEVAFENENIRKFLNSELVINQAAIYHDTNFILDDNSILFFGLRSSIFNAKYNDINSIKEKIKQFNWAAHIGRAWSGINTQSSIRLARGFKAGGVNIGTNINTDRRTFDSESLYSLEAKHLIEKDLGSYEFNIFVNYREDVQVKTSFQDDPTDPSSFTFYTNNATTGHSYGVEIKATQRPIFSYQVQLSGSVMKSEYGDYLYGKRNLKGRSFSYAPEYKINLENKFYFNTKINLSLEHLFQDSFYLGNSHDQKAPESIITNTHLQYNNSTYTLRLSILNLFQEAKHLRGFYFGNRPPNFDSEKFVHLNAPRSFRLSLSAFF